MSSARDHVAVNASRLFASIALTVMRNQAVLAAYSEVCGSIDGTRVWKFDRFGFWSLSSV